MDGCRGSCVCQPPSLRLETDVQQNQPQFIQRQREGDEFKAHYAALRQPLLYFA